MIGAAKRITRRLSLSSALAVSALAGCSAVGYHAVPPAAPPVAEATQVDAVSGAATPAERAPMVLLVTIDGLRQDVLEAHLEDIDRNDLDPPWRSGLALLRQRGFNLGYSTRAEASLPGAGLGPLATLLTGEFARAHGVPGSTFYEARANGDLIRYDFRAPTEAAQVFYGLDQSLPTSAETPTLANRLLRSPTVMERLAPTHSATAVFFPMARGARWLVPRRAGVGVRAMLRDANAGPVMPIFDRGVRNATVDLVLDEADALPDLMALYFGSVISESCFQEDERCSGAVGDLAEIQRKGLKQVDAHLWRALDKLARAHPERLPRMTVVLTGAAGMVDRTIDADGAREPASSTIEAAALGGQLAALVEDAHCKQWLKTARSTGELVIAPEGGSAQLYLAERPVGARVPLERGRRCLGLALEAAVGKVPWLAAGAWIPSSLSVGDGELKMPGAPHRVKLASKQRRRWAAYRRAGLAEKIRATLASGPDRRSGDATLFAAPPWRFVDEGTRARALYAYQGTLDDAAVQVPFLIASKALPPTVIAELRVSALEIADVTPTLLALLQAPEAAFAGLPRPPVVRWRADEVDGSQLEMVRADRQLKGDSAVVARARPVWIEGPDRVQIGLVESADLREPDAVQLRLGDTQWSWTYDDGFPEGAPCAVKEEGGARRWLCEAPRGEPGASTMMAARRDPTSDEEGDGVEDFLQAVVWHDPTARSTLKEVADVTLQCASAEGVRLTGPGLMDKAISRIRVALIPAGQSHDQGVLYGDAFGSATLVESTPSEACDDKGPMDAACVLEQTSTREPQRWIAFDARHLDHYLRTLKYDRHARQDRAALRARHQTLTEGLDAEGPDAAWLAVDLCSADGTCVRRPLASDRAYRRALGAPCPTP